MTTVDASISRVGDEESLRFSCGLFGSAADILNAGIDLCEAGDATGRWSFSSLDVTTTGAKLRPLLERQTASENGWGSPTTDELDNFRRRLDNTAMYRIWAVEF